MKRLFTLVGGTLAAMMIVACGAAPGGPGASPAQVDADAARSALCAQGSDTSLAGLATQLEGLTDDADTTAVNTAIGTTMADLQSAQLEGTEAAVRDAAVTALGQIQQAIDDPATRGQAASTAAGALRAADAEIC